MAWISKGIGNGLESVSSGEANTRRHRSDDLGEDLALDAVGEKLGRWFEPARHDTDPIKKCLSVALSSAVQGRSAPFRLAITSSVLPSWGD